MIYKIQYKNTTIRFKDEGNGLPVVLLHGYLEALEIWGEFAGALCESYRVISIDLPGHGETGVVGEVSSMEFMAEIVKEVLDHLTVEKCVLFGHSMGGYAALAFLELYPERLIGFSLFHSKPQPDNAEAIENRKRGIELVKQGKRDLIINVNIPNGFANKNLQKLEHHIEFAKQVGKNTSDEGIIAALNGMMLRPSREKLLSEFQLPFLFVLGKLDNYIPFDSIYEKFKMPVKSEYLVLENSGHMGFMEEKKKALDGVKSFLEKVSKEL